MPRKGSDLAMAAAALALFALLALLRASSQDAQRPSFPSTYDTGANGYAALYDMLALEGAHVQRFERPIGELSPGHATLVVAGRGALVRAAPSRGAQAFLNSWVLRGGTLVVLDDALAGAVRGALALPQPQPFKAQRAARAGCAFVQRLQDSTLGGSFDAGFTPACTRDRATVFTAGGRAAGIALRRGRGTIVLVTSPAVFDNLHIAQDANARIAYALFARGNVFFDERVHGYAAGRSFWDVLPMPMHVAIALAVFAALLAVAGENLPFAPRAAAQTVDERDSGAYIASVAGMLQRASAAREAIARIAARCDSALASRPGDERARMLLRELRTVQAAPSPGAHELLQAGRIYARVRKDYGC